MRIRRIIRRIVTDNDFTAARDGTTDKNEKKQEDDN